MSQQSSKPRTLNVLRPRRGLRRVAAAGLVLLLFVPTIQSAERPQGQVLKPRLTGLDVPADRSTNLTLKGWVDFPGSRGSVRIGVLIQGNGDSSDPFLWTEVLTVFPSNTATVVNGQNRFSWETSQSVSFLLGGNRWPEGGTARLRFRARLNSGGFTYLPIQDGDGVAGNVVDLVLSDKNPTPAALPPDKSPDYLNRKDVLSQDETGKYYLSVGTDQKGGGIKILSAIFTLGSFKQRYFESAANCPSSTPEYTTKYFNKGDLGLGREMHCVWNGCTRETACYVQNYGRDDGTPLFNNRAEARKALLAKKPFATVAMVERQAMPVGAPNKVFFVVYDHQRLLNPDDPDSAPVSLEAPLDTKGFNKSIPANCLVCHGPASQYEKNTSASFPFNANVTGAEFLPFDLQAFEFFSSNDSSSLSRASQEHVFKGLNQLVYFTDLYFNRDANEMIDGFYGGPAQSSPTFQDDFIPDGWRNPDVPADDANRRQLYRKVVAKACRTCHIAHAQENDPFVAGLTFGTFDQFSSSKALVYADICITHQMPNAEQSLKVLWRSSARSHLLNRLGLPQGCGVQADSSASAAARAASSRAALEVFQSYEAESCGCTTVDCLREVDDKYLEEFAAAKWGASEEEIAHPRSAAMECRLRVLTAAADVASGQTVTDRVSEREWERYRRELNRDQP